MEAAAYSLGALLAWIAAIAVYHLTTACVGTVLGIRVREVAIGYGPTAFMTVGRLWTLRIEVIPLGGYTQFYGSPTPPKESRYGGCMPTPSACCRINS